MNNPENTASHGNAMDRPAKKAWNNGPELVLINHNVVNTKSHPHFYEKTASVFIKTGVPYVTNNASASFKGTIYQALS